jgi:hypothetical protein
MKECVESSATWVRLRADMKFCTGITDASG